MHNIKFFTVCLLLLLLKPWSLLADPIDIDIPAIHEQLVEREFAGIVWVASGETIQFHNAYGLADRERGIAFSNNAVFDIGSITKQFLAVAILHLQEQGKLSVTDTLSAFFPGVPKTKQAISIHHLLTHTAGFPANLKRHRLYERVPYAQLPTLAFKETLLSLPGERYHYSNIGYSLLARIVEQVSQQNWEAYVRQQVLLPAGLTQTGYRLVDFDRDQLTVNYGADQNGFQRLLGLEAKVRSVGHSLQHRFDKPGERWFEGAGGFLSTVTDMQQWYLVLRAKHILSNESWRRIFAPHIIESSQSHYGYGWSISEHKSGQRVVAHNGSNGYSFADFRYYPELDLFVFVATNDIDNYPTDLMKQLNTAAVNMNAKLPDGTPKPTVDE